MQWVGKNQAAKTVTEQWYQTIVDGIKDLWHSVRKRIITNTKRSGALSEEATEFKLSENTKISKVYQQRIKVIRDAITEAQKNINSMTKSYNYRNANKNRNALLEANKLLMKQKQGLKELELDTKPKP